MLPTAAAPDATGPFAVTQDAATGRRWRYRLPLLRVAFSVLLLLAGLVLLPLGLALPSLACAVAGGLALLPGAFATYAYYRIHNGTFVGRYETFLEAEDVLE
jgi:hypothetical protein